MMHKATDLETIYVYIYIDTFLTTFTSIPANNINAMTKIVLSMNHNRLIYTKMPLLCLFPKLNCF